MQTTSNPRKRVLLAIGIGVLAATLGAASAEAFASVPMKRMGPYGDDQSGTGGIGGSGGFGFGGSGGIGGSGGVGGIGGNGSGGVAPLRE